MQAGILGTGIYLPEGALTNEELAERFGLPPEELFALSGIRRRRIAAPEQACSDLAIAAARQALENAGTAPEEIGMVIVATSTGDYPTPSTAVLVQKGLGIPAAGCFDLKANCAGFIYGIMAGSSLVSSGLASKVLLVGAEVLSRFINPTDMDSLLLFGDGAGAVVLGPVPEGYGLLSSDAGSNGEDYDALIVEAGGSRLPLSLQTLERKQELVRMDGGRIFMFAMRALGDSALRVIRKAGLDVEDIDLFIPHQANRRIIEAAARRLELPLDRFVMAMEDCGNTSSAALPIALHQAVVQGRISPGDRLVMTGFGAGVCWGSILLRWGSGTQTNSPKRRQE